ncbi:response regulator transcription factor [Roseovarius salinarum]|uniref:response regulator transcription factor n=1 Tax=Roseovarius salinarum TaxID=1981892 RepID=UPI000C322C30|nr:response regulator [Roseovarius salinarum]
MKILAVDDDDMIIRFLDGSLRGLGYDELTFAQSAQDALEKIDAAPEPFECFLLDIMMPGMDGIELCSRIRSIPLYENTPIIMLTAVKEKQAIHQSFANGATDYVTKPFDITELGARIRVANMLFVEQRRSADKAFAAQTLKSQLDKDLSFPLSEPVLIRDVPGFIGAVQLENYMLQLSHIGMFKSAAIGFQINGITDHYNRTTPTDFFYLLTDVADAIFSSLDGTEAMLSYLGFGSYVAVVPRVNRLSTEEMQERIQVTLDDYELVDSNGKPMPTHVTVGPQTLGSLFGSNAKMILNRAVNAAQVHSGETALQEAG